MIKTNNHSDLIFVFYEPLLNSLNSEDLLYLIEEFDLIKNYFIALRNKDEVSWLVEGNETLFNAKFLKLFKNHLKEKIIETIQENDVYLLTTLIKVNLLNYLDKEDFALILHNLKINFLENIIKALKNMEYFGKCNVIDILYWGELFFEELYEIVPKALSKRLTKILEKCNKSELSTITSLELLNYIRKEDFKYLIYQSNIPQHVRMKLKEDKRIYRK